MTPSPSPMETFTDVTFRSSVQVSDERVEEATDGSGVMYRISFNVTLAADGVVSLSPLVGSAQVTCNTDGSVRIQLSSSAPVAGTVQDMYPQGAVLVIGRDDFGECRLTLPGSVPDETEEERQFRLATDANAALFRDAYLLIDSASGTPNDAVVRGTATTFFALFDKGSIKIRPDSIGSVNSRQMIFNDSALVLPETSRAVSLNFESDLAAIGPLKLRVTGKGTSKGEFVSFDADWDLFGVNIEFKFINEWEFTVSLEARLSIGTGVGGKVVDLLSVPLYGLPKIDFFAKLDLGRFRLPEFKLGFYFEIPFIWRVDAKLEKSVASVASASYTTTRTEVTLFIRGPYLDLDIGADTNTLAPASRDFTFNPSLADNSPAEVTFEFFGGIRPQFAAYVPIFSARVSVESGVLINAKYDILDSTAFLPFSGGGGTIGICEDCHDLEIGASGIIRNAGIFASLSLDLGVQFFGRNITIPIRKTLASINLPGNPSGSVELATGCFTEPMGASGPLHFIAASNICAECPEEKPKYNPTRQECEEECLDPDKPFFNVATGECEPCPPQTPTYNPKLQVCEANCPGGSRAGNNVPFFGSFELGAMAGSFNFEYEHFTIRDRMEVIYEGSVIFDTGCVGGGAMRSLSYNGTATNVIVKVTPNCAGTSGTAWNFGVACPSS